MFSPGLKLTQDETWTYFDGPSWIQYDLFRKNKLLGSKNVNLAKFMLRAFIPSFYSPISNRANFSATVFPVPVPVGLAIESWAVFQ